MSLAFRYLLLLLLTIGLQQTALAGRCSDKVGREVEGELILADAEPFTKKASVPASHVYTKVRGKAGVPLFIESAEAYREMIRREEIMPFDIIFIERLPLDVDLPLVRGVVMGTPLTAEGTHIQVLAEKLQIPLVVAPNFMLSREIRAIKQYKSPIFLHSAVKKERSFDIYPQKKVEADIVANSALPEKGDRKIVEVAAVTDTKIERMIFGDKFVPLKELAGRVDAKFLPTPFYSISSGLYLRFLESYMTARGQPLIDYLTMRRIHLANTTEFPMIRETLAEIRETIMSAKPIGRANVLAELSTVLKKLYGENFKDLSLRSNNDVEDLIGAGLYKSIVLKDLSVAELERGYKEIVSSMFSFRAYTIRRERGLREDRLAMPLLIHPYVRGEAYSATARFWYEDGQIVGEYSLIEGRDSKATNPDGRATVVEVLLARDALGNIKITHQEGQLTKAAMRGVKKSFALLATSLEASFFDRIYPPMHVDVELLLRPAVLSYHPVFLQYKNTISHELLIDVLNGRIGREDVESSINGVDGVAKDSLSSLLKKANLHFAPTAREAREEDFERFLLFREPNGKVFYIFWRDGRYHEAVHETLKKAHMGLRILGGGYWVIDAKTGEVTMENSGIKNFQMNPNNSVDRSRLRDGLLDVMERDSYWRESFHLYRFKEFRATGEVFLPIFEKKDFPPPSPKE